MLNTAALEALTTRFGAALTRSNAELEAHGRSETHFPLTPPDAVIYPENTEQVSEIVRICGAHGCPIVPWGAGTSLEGHALAINGGISVDFSRMNRVLSINPDDMDVIVQPGITRIALNEELRATGLFFPIDPGADASLGGMAATRASGTTTVRYGTMRQSVLALEVVLASGEVIRTGSRARKTSAGYDMTGLFVGSEGTLGLITELTLRLQGQPESTVATVCAFDSIDQAVAASTLCIQMGLSPARLELLDSETVAAVNAYSKVDFPQQPHLLAEFHGTEAAAAEAAERFGEIIAETGGSGYDWSAKEEERRRLWHMRHTAYWAILGLRPGARAVVTDMCVPISRMAEAAEETRADIAASRLTGPLVGHVGDGNLHAVLLVDTTDQSEMSEAHRLAERMAERALRLGGTVTGEHGVGIGKLNFMSTEHGSVGWAAMGAIKQALDPQNILNPGKVVEGGNRRAVTPLDA